MGWCLRFGFRVTQWRKLAAGGGSNDQLRTDGSYRLRTDGSKMLRT